MRDFFNQNNGANIPSYVDRLMEDLQTDIEPGDADLPWLSDDPLPQAGRGGGWLGRLWRLGGAPAPGRRGPDLASLLTGSFLGSRGGIINPAGSAAKLISLTAVPGFYALTWYIFFRLFMGWGEYSSLVVGFFVLFFALRDSIRSLGDRPTFLEVLRLFMHEAALVWLMWVFTSMAYTVVAYSWWMPYFLATFVGLLVAGGTYFLAMGHVARRTGAGSMPRYLFQVLAVVLTTTAGVGLGYALAPLLWPLFLSADCPSYGNYLASMLFGFVFFWVGVNQFYIKTGRRGATSQLERGWDVGVA